MSYMLANRPASGIVTSMKLHPDKQFRPTITNICEIMEYWGLTARAYKTPSSGIDNTTILVDCDEGKFVLRIYRQDKKTDEHIHQEIAFMQYLRTHSIPVPHILPTTTGKLQIDFIYYNTKWQVILMEFIDGRHTTSYAPRLLKDLAITQAKMHLLSGSFDDPLHGEVQYELRDEQVSRHINMTGLTDQRLIAFLNRAQQYQVTLSHDTSGGLCHMDYDAGNVLASADNRLVAVLDFDDLVSIPYVVDLGYTLWDIFCTEDAAAAQQYLVAYEKMRPLTKLERSSLRSIILFRHYFICAIKILHGHTAQQEINAYLEFEEEIQKQSFR